LSTIYKAKIIPFFYLLQLFFSNLLSRTQVSSEDYYLKTYPIQTTGKGVFIGIEETGLMSWLK
jgi:hypothetical protein